MKNMGVILAEPSPTDYIVGSKSPLVHGVKFPDGHGIMDFILAGEFQKKAFESMGCVSMSSNHNTQLVKKIEYGVDENESDRFTIVGSGTTDMGNDLNTVAEFKRKNGFVLEDEYPWPADMDKDTFFKRILQDIYDLALKHKAQWLYNHEWVEVGRGPNNIIDVLKTGCPVQATITDWRENSNGINVSTGSSQIHAIDIVDYSYGNYYWIFDQYNESFVYDGNTDPKRFLKKFAWYFPFGFWGKKYTVTRTAAEPSQDLLLKIKNMISKFIKMNFYKDSTLPKGTGSGQLDNPDNLADGSVFLCKDDEAMKIDNLNKILAMLEVVFSEIGYKIPKTDWMHDLGKNYKIVNRFSR